ncbi:RraA family protein [Methanoculleus sp. Wushi-C6]|uniref:RraA family protein n=1 Tax=Methanoculleus caldifontis TaxID=2651577 RepID=A0ABU3X3U6_9EURY|nr:RraA family protein [Methanoculleus sp. Wushi-C6]MDV2482611.1 RraA family protein [Methanoculleus sp. Wushi-C6]
MTTPDTYTDQIISKIKRNRISSTEVADCLGKTGNVPGVLPLNYGHFCVGQVRWTYALNESNWEFHRQITDVDEGEILFVEPFNCSDRAIFGSLVSKYLILYQQAAGIVVQGYLRDIPHLRKENWPIWCFGGTPIGCFNRKNETDLDPALIHERCERYNGAIAVCDDSGVIIIPKDHINQEFLEKLDWIEEQEDIWFDCIDRLKWNTYDTVCLKKYQERKQ